MPYAPRSTHFPYTTLFRSHESRRRSPAASSIRNRPASDRNATCSPRCWTRRRRTRESREEGRKDERQKISSRGRSTGRSEEHTSELQSQSNLVCRLLLEKK